ncbi:peptidylglycine alpha-hydroxylating monooxygenase [Prorops nasuta]|uniref:peptidylglycine alpha-hydroxylating monooxygenase n=1 Tax=Prorops nasuta TaxID=863751 RepID=UPI0034CDBF50
MKNKLAFLIFLFLLNVLNVVESTKKYSLLMPNVSPDVPELYLCTPAKINITKSYYITGFQPNATMHTAHHMLLYGCLTPGSSKAVWNCGEMASSNDHLGNSAPPCKEQTQIIYSWARDAPTLMLPEGVGFKVGADSTIKYLVLQVHYLKVDQFKNGATDDSGVYLYYTTSPLNKLAGVLLLGTAGTIPPKSTEYMESACAVKENNTIYPFAYRIHTHSLGKVVAGYVVQKNGTWIELGKKDPMEPQMFYPTLHDTPITTGDQVAARCTMESNRETWTNIGSTHHDEMCNFYLMYYVKNGNPLNMKYCFTRGPPAYRWQYAGLRHIPHKKASSLDL